MPNLKYIKIAQDYIRYLTSMKLVFDRCYLFGSCVRGTNTKDSDIDILLVSNCFLFPNKKHIHYLHYITEEYNNSIHLHTISIYKFNIINPNQNNNYFDLGQRSIYEIFYPVYFSQYFLPPHPHSTVQL